MERYYARYELWEDYKNGMFDKPIELEREQLVASAKVLLSNCSDFENAAKNVLADWVISSAVNLTNKSENRRAWIGQAACSYIHKVPEILTRQAWAQLSEKQRADANKIADKIIKHFEANHAQSNISVRDRLGAERLF